MSFNTITKFENAVAEFFGSPYAVAVDSCTHGIELCLRRQKIKSITVPRHTYVSVPLLANKLNIKLNWKDENWKDFYYLGNTNIIGGMILCDNKEEYHNLKKMVYDGRHPDTPWRDQNISMIGYHYYMTPETAQNGLDKFDEAVNTPPKQWNVNDWPDLTKMDIFKNSL